jgi:rubrerythrin
MTRIPNASVVEQELYDHVAAHGKNEGEVLEAYAELAEHTDSPAFAFLARLILEDERRHHQMLDALAESIRNTAELTGRPSPIPDLALFNADRDRILVETERFLALEKEDDKHLDRLARDLKDVRDTTLWELVVRMMQADNAKHRRILEFIRARAREGIG